MKDQYKVTFTLTINGYLSLDEIEPLIKEQWEQTASHIEGDTISDIQVEYLGEVQDE